MSLFQISPGTVVTLTEIFRGYLQSIHGRTGIEP